MDVEQVRYFLAVSETGSFTLAAKRCGVAQPSLSQQVQRLEKGLGRKLFDRLPRRVLLTEAGRELLDRGRKLVEAFEAFGEKALGGRMGGSLVVGASPTVAAFVVGEAVAEFVKGHAGVEVSMQELPTEVLLERVKAGEVDVGIVGVSVEDSALLVEALFTEMLVVAVPARHRFAKGDGLVTMGDVMGETVILLDEMKGIFPMGGKGRRRGGVLRGSGLQVSTVEALVRKGVGVCVLPAMAREGRGKGIVYVGFREGGPVRVVSAVWHRDRVRSLAAVGFMEILRGVVGRVL